MTTDATATVSTAPRRTRRLRAPLLAAASAGIAAVLARVVSQGALPFVPPCPTHALFGLNCPLCGGTRALAALGAGHWQVAAVDNVLVVIAVPLAVTWWLWWLIASWRGKRATVRVPRWGWWALIALIALFTILRNLPPMHGVLAP